MPYWDDDIAAFADAAMQAADTLLLGRVTYQAFAAAFASSSGPDAEAMNAYRKYVVSTTLQQADWNNPSLVTSNVVEQVTRLKQQPGQDIGMSGSGTLVQSLLRHNLNLKLKQSTTSRSGVLLSTYQLA
jgi:dihydrofolate reductase